MRVLAINCGSSTLKFRLSETSLLSSEREEPLPVHPGAAPGGEAPGSRLQDRAPTLISECEAMIAKATAYSREHYKDMPEIRDWVWSP